MARPGVTLYDITQAAEALRAQGNEPTIDRVREKLGTGSKSTIAPLLKKWKSTKEQSVKESETGLPADLVHAVKSLQDRIQMAADQAVEEAKQDFQARVQMLEEKLADAQKELTEALDREGSLKQQVIDFESNSRSLGSKLNDLESRLLVTEAEREALQTRAQELKEAISELKAENRGVRDHLEHYQQRTAEDRQLERDQFQSQLRQLQTQVESLTRQFTHSQAEKEDYRARYESAQGRAEKITYENQELRHKSQSSRARVKELEADSENKKNEIKGFNQHISLLRVEVQDLKERLARKSVTLESVETALHEAREQVNRLEVENKETSQEKAILQGRMVQLQGSFGGGG